MKKPSNLFMIHLLVLVSLVFGLSSCGGTPEALETHTLQIRISATTDVNPDVESRPSPIILHVLELTGVDEFNRADYFSLTRQDANALGGDVLSKTEIILTPGANKTIELELKQKAAYLGFVGGYRDIDNSRWRVSQEVVPGSTDWISVEIGKNQISINEVND